MTELFFRVHEPEGGAALTAIAVHGYGSNEEDLLGLGRELGLPVRVVAPRGPMELRHAFGLGYAWFSFTSAGQPESESFRHAVDALARLVRDVRARWNVPREKLVMMGFSQGAVMSIAVALSALPELGGVVALSGYYPRPEGWTLAYADLHGLPVLVTHGTYDDVLPVEWGRDAAETLQAMGADVRYAEFPMAHQVSPDCLATVRSWLKEKFGL